MALRARFVFAAAILLAAVALSPTSLLPVQAQEPRTSGAFVAPATRAVLGESRVLVLRLADPARRDREFDVRVQPADALEVLTPLHVLGGYELAFVRVRARTAGAVTVSVPELGASCRLDVRRRPGGTPPPRFLTPAEGAVVWGEVAVGFHVPGARPARAILRAGDREIARTGSFHEVTGGFDASVTVDVTELPAGSSPMQLDVTRADGHQRTGEPVTVMVAHPAGGVAPSLSAVALAQQDPPAELLEEFDEEDEEIQPWHFVEDAAAPDGVCVAHHEPWPPTRVPVDGGEDGAWLQMAVIARGDPAGGVWPRISVTRDREEAWLTTGSLVRAGWHRVTVGTPVWVPPGRHWLQPMYTNDFDRPRAFDRNLYLGRVELLPVPGDRSPDASVALQTPLHGQPVQGALDLDAVVGMPPIGYDEEEDEAEYYPTMPVCVLEVNGREVARQASRRPRFRIGTDRMVRGENTVRLWLDAGDGEAVVATTGTFRWTGSGSRPDGLLRFTAADPRWQGHEAEFEEECPDGRALCFTDGAESATLSLPDHLDGRYELAVMMRGQELDGPARVRVAFNGERRGSQPAPEWWEPRPFGEVRLTRGTSGRVTVSLANPRSERRRWWRRFQQDGEDGDEADEDDEDDEPDQRRLWIAAVELRPLPDRPDRTAPGVEWVYPADGATIAATDAVVLDVTDASGVLAVQLTLDGRPVPGAFVNLAEMRQPDARVCIPFTTRQSAGRHRLGVYVVDRAENTTPLTRSVTVSDDASASPFARAVHLLNRFAYGPEPRLLAELLTASAADDDNTDGMLGVLRRWLTAGPDARANGSVVSAFPQERDGELVMLRLVQLGMTTRHPARYRVSMFLENHFSTWLPKTGGSAEYREWQRNDRIAAGRFRDALFASATSPAMMAYLDNFASFAGSINENYARELLELHTLGVDNGYDQLDIIQLARALTGWGLASRPEPEWPTDFAFHARLHDRDEVRVIGFRLDALPPGATAAQARARGVAVLEMLAAHPGTARFVCRKLAAQYLSTVTDDVVDAMGETFLATDGDLAEVLLTLAAHPRFVADAGQRGTDPLEYGLRMCRCGHFPEPWLLFEFLHWSQRMPGLCVTPDGYPTDAKVWLDSNGVHQRWRFMGRAGEEMRWRLFLGPARWETRRFDADWNRALIDQLAVQLLGHRLAEASHAAAMKALANVDEDFDVNDRVGLAITLVGQLPDANRH